jgi:hypothetical protein
VFIGSEGFFAYFCTGSALCGNSAEFFDVFIFYDSNNFYERFFDRAMRNIDYAEICCNGSVDVWNIRNGKNNFDYLFSDGTVKKQTTNEHDDFPSNRELRPTKKRKNKNLNSLYSTKET